MRRGFTLIELLVVIAIIGILVVAVTVAINPVKRIEEAKTSALQARVSSAGDKFNLCMNHYDGSIGTQNGYTKCSDFSKLISPTTPGGPFIKSAPTDSGWVFQSSSSGSGVDGCLYNSVSLFDKVIYIQYESLNNGLKTYESAPTCP